MEVPGCVVLAGLGLIGWLAYKHLPVSLFSLGAGGAALGLNLLRAELATPPPETIRGRIALALVSDTRMVGFLLFLGFTLVWLTQILFDLFGPTVEPDSAGTFELRLYDLARRIDALGSLTLLAALLLSMLVGAVWPLTATNRLRKILAGFAVALAAMSTFTFVTASHGSNRFDAESGPIRAAIVRNLETLMQERRLHAALQWLSAELSREEKEDPQTSQGWQDYFQAARLACWEEQAEFVDGYQSGAQSARGATLSSYDPYGPQLAVPQPNPEAHCDPADFLGDLARKRIRERGPASPSDARWIPDHAATMARMTVAPAEGGEAGSGLGLGELLSLRDRTGRASGQAASARDAIRETAIEAVSVWVGPDLAGAAGKVVDAWTGALASVLAAESAPSVARRLRLLANRVTRFLAPPPAVAALASGGFPLETASRAQARTGSIEEVVRRDRDALGLPPAREAGVQSAEAEIRKAIEARDASRSRTSGGQRAPGRGGRR
jgi:hypothetical protein